MEKISAFFVIIFLVSSCMVEVTVTKSFLKLCQTDQDCVDYKFPNCESTGKPPICQNNYCWCPDERLHASTTPLLTATSNS
ncbi:hypothetical protein Bca4012_091132 [Brassica carinata]|uniref:Nodule Cysteine-Rich (NCR) secreted peptide n=3 Tax=Brassica TaxID=3705 RepID=A0ABQ8BJY8_BRANA|nr:hypothetical protein HID58_044501 [Brassica napus]VDD53028.1 unnamed protein product [Brassica oleracea]